MLLAFLLGLLAVVANIAVIAILLLTINWVKEYITKRMKSHNAHKVAFADTRETVGEYIKSKSVDAEEISMEELERMCDETPFVAADIDEDGNITRFEGIKAEDVDTQVKLRMKQQNGMIVIKG